MHADYARAARRNRVVRFVKGVARLLRARGVRVVALGPFIYLISPAFRQRSSSSRTRRSGPRPSTRATSVPSSHDTSFLRWTLNTFIFASCVTIITLFLDSLAGFAFAKMRFPGRPRPLLFVLATLMVPTAALLAPLYLTVKELRPLNTYPGLILPMIVSPLGVFMMRQFIETLPEGIYEAARLDGASEFRSTAGSCCR